MIQLLNVCSIQYVVMYDMLRLINVVMFLVAFDSVGFSLGGIHAPVKT